MPTSYVEAILLYIPLAGLTSFFAWKFGFYRLPAEPRTLPDVRFYHLLLAFFIYPFFSHISLWMLLNWTSLSMASPIFKLVEYTFPLALLYLCFQVFPIERSRLIWSGKPQRERKKEIAIGIATWLVAFPIVALVAYFCDLFLVQQLRAPDYEQNAVVFLKSSLSSLPALAIAGIALLIFAPFLEEFLFRGLLQSWLRKYLRPLPAIAFASLAFAILHFSFAQGWGNLTLLSSLFTLGCFLGFLYERERSLLAPISLHCIFNLITTLRIFLSSQE